MADITQKIILTGNTAVLNDLNDVGALAPDTNEVLFWNGSIWGPGAATGAGIASNSITTVKIQAGAVDFSKQANLVQGRLIGRGGASGTGIPELLTIGAGLDLAGTVISATGAAPSLNDVTDVTLTSPATDSILIKTAGDWVDGLIVTNSITNAAVSYVKIQPVGSASRILGRGSAGGAGVVEELVAGTGLSISGTSLDVDADVVTKVNRIGHSYLVSGSIAVPSGQTDFIVPFTVQFASGQTANLVTARYSINAGTSVTLDVTRNGSNITGYTGISVTTTPATTTQTQALSSDDELAIVISGVSGSPFNLSFTLFIEYSQ